MPQPPDDRLPNDETPTAGARLRSILECADVGLALVDGDGAVTFANDAFCRLLAVGPATLERLPLVQIAHPADRAAAELAVASVAASSKGRATWSGRFVRSDGTLVWAEMRLSHDGVAAETIAVILDLTERRLVEERQNAAERHNARLYREARDANHAKDEFLAMVSHELRTPMNSILGWTRLLRERQLDEQNAERALDTIERNIIAQVRIIDDLLDVSRIISGNIRLEPTPLDLVALVNAAIESLRPAAATRLVRVEFASGSHPHGLVAGDANRLQQVIWNLLSNAVKFTPRGGRIAVRLEYDDAAVRIVVADTGSGIDPEFLPHVFERFRQADVSTTRRHGGLGLGLAIVRHLVEMHGGSVRAESEGAGLGATFTVSLPVSPVPFDPRAGHELVPPDRDEAAYAGDAALAGLRVLVIDDEADTRDMLVLALGGAGAEVATAASVDEALDAFGRFLPDVLITDIAMPGKDGYDLIEVVRMLGAQTPAIALTAYAHPRDREHALGAGFDAHLSKPFDTATLVEIIRRLRPGAPSEAR